jgi:AcrR family transcriptional regulator
VQHRSANAALESNHAAEMMSRPAPEKAIQAKRSEARRPRVKRTQAERSVETRDKLCRAALDAMNEVGYGRFATEDVAERAQVSRGALTHQFPTRNHLIVAAYDYLMREWERDWARTTLHPTRLAPVEVTQLFWSRLFQSKHYVASLEIMLAARNDDDLGKEIRAIMARWSDHRDRLIAHLLGTSESDERMRSFIQLNLCVLRGIALHHNFSTDSSVELQRRLLEMWKQMIEHEFRFIHLS